MSDYHKYHTERKRRLQRTKERLKELNMYEHQFKYERNSIWHIQKRNDRAIAIHQVPTRVQLALTENFEKYCRKPGDYTSFVSYLAGKQILSARERDEYRDLIRKLETAHIMRQFDAKNDATYTLPKKSSKKRNKKSSKLPAHLKPVNLLTDDEFVAAQGQLIKGGMGICTIMMLLLIVI